MGQSLGRPFDYDSYHQPQIHGQAHQPQRSRRQPPMRRAKQTSNQSRDDVQPRRPRVHREASGSLSGRQQTTVHATQGPKRRQKSTDKPLAHSHQDHTPRNTQEPELARKPRVRAARAPSRLKRAHEKQPHSTVDSKVKSGNITVTELSHADDKKDCMICVKSRSSKHFPRRPPTQQCIHEIKTCKRCLRKWIQTQFSNKMWNQIGCPECGISLQYDDVREFASKSVFRR